MFSSAAKGSDRPDVLEGGARKSRSAPGDEPRIEEEASLREVDLDLLLALLLMDAFEGLRLGLRSKFAMASSCSGRGGNEGGGEAGGEISTSSASRIQRR